MKIEPESSAEISGETQTFKPFYLLLTIYAVVIIVSIALRIAIR